MFNHLYTGLLYSGMLLSCPAIAQTQPSLSSAYSATVPLTKDFTDSTQPGNSSRLPLPDTLLPKEGTNTTSLTDVLRLPLRDPLTASFKNHTVPEIKTPLVSKPLSARSLILPATMIGFGAYSLYDRNLKNLNLSLRKEIWQDRANKKNLPIDNVSMFAPAVAVYALNIAGVKGKNNFVDRSIMFTMSNLIGHGMFTAIKRSSHILRPDGSNQLSFPSGHTAQAFISAEFLRQEYKDVSPWYGIAGYAVAAGTGYLRMYNNKHWLNDVVAGAGVGILSTRISYWLYPKIKNSIFKGKSSGTIIMPTYQQGAFGLGMVHKF